MSARPLPRSRLDNLIPPLVDGQALVALVPATGDLRWAAAAAWDVARAAALHGRRVALVDLWIEDPTLHEVVGLSPTEGIVDAFEYGVSLTKTAHEVDHVFFIAAGAYTAHPGELFGHERWKKLHGGFRVEGALLLLYLSAGGLARLSAVPDGLIVLSPDGFEPESSIGQGITAALERGIPLVGVVREHWTPAPGPAGDAPEAAIPPRPSRPRSRSRDGQGGARPSGITYRMAPSRPATPLPRRGRRCGRTGWLRRVRATCCGRRTPSRSLKRGGPIACAPGVFRRSRGAQRAPCWWGRSKPPIRRASPRRSSGAPAFRPPS